MRLQPRFLHIPTLALVALTAAAGLLVSVCMILAFWPPAAYLDFVRGGRAPAGP